MGNLRAIKRMLRWRWLCVVCVTSCTGTNQSTSITVVVRQPAYPRPACAKDSATIRQRAPAGRVIANAAVTLTEGFDNRSVRRTTTDASGIARFDRLSPGTYRISLAAEGYRSALSAAVVRVDKNQARRAKKSLHTAVELTPCWSAGTSQYRVGFDQTVILQAKNLCGEAMATQTTDAPTLSWRQVDGPRVSSVTFPHHKQRWHFKTHQLHRLRPLPDQPQLLSFSPDEAGEYVFELQARTKSNQVIASHVLVTATDVHSGVTSGPPGQRYYFVGDVKGPWQWRVTNPRKDVTVQLEGSNSRVVSVIATPTIKPARDAATRPINLILAETQHQRTFNLSLGDWDMVPRDCSRSECHQSLTAQWAQTTHAQTWQRLVDGKTEIPVTQLTQSCAKCHALGYDPSLDTGGYDDVANYVNYRISDIDPKQSSHYRHTPEALKQVSNVYCLACHGAARLDPPFGQQPGLFEPGVCAQCHDHQPAQSTVAQWRQSKHAQPVRAATEEAACKNCHTAQGFYLEHFALARPGASGTATLSCCDNAAPITCQACHHPMSAAHPAQLYITDNSHGTGAICVKCHTSTSSSGLHAPQADLIKGMSDQSRGCGAAAPNGCVTCHMNNSGPSGTGGHTFAMRTREGKLNQQVCSSCHGQAMNLDLPYKSDLDTDGTREPFQVEIDGLLATLKSDLIRAITRRGYRSCSPSRSAGTWAKLDDKHRIVITDAKTHDLGDCNRNGAIDGREHPFVVPQTDTVLLQPLNTYFLITQDRSRGLHNPPYVLQLLQQSISQGLR